ncbi:RHS repeat-associated core domain-containing protein, partial [candidate division WOR-3 bacterium]|nr:RHS repeat-associated core domain-containing protein [candidate division WOR-3 bacterium]
IAKQYKYYAFGDLRYESGTYYDNHKFTGKEEDGSGLYYFGARYYDKSIGRWISPDPASYPSDLRLNDPQSFNPYVYCRNNPLALKDPDGNAYYEVGTNKLLYTSDIVDLLIQTAGSALRGEAPVLPIYWQAAGTWTDIETLGFKQGLFGYAPNFTYGPGKKTEEGYSYNLIRATADKNLSLGIPIGQTSPQILGKTSTGQHVLQLKFGGRLIQNKEIINGSDCLIIFTGTMVELNELLNEEGMQIVRRGEREYEIIERETNED